MQQFQKILTLFTFIISLAVYSYGSECSTLATGLLNHLGSQKQIKSIEEIEQNGEKSGCVASFSDGGYALISYAKNSSPIQSYSLFGDFSTLPLQAKEMLQKDLHKLKLYETTDIHPQRRYLLDKKTKNLQKLFATNSSLPLDSKWNQDGLYQTYMPKIDGKSTLVGCVNVALGQIMRFHQYPKYGSGEVATTFNGETLRAITNRIYNWSHMPVKLDNNAKEYQIDEVGMLLYDLAIGNKTSFGVAGSGASLNIATLYKNFGYSKNIEKISASDKVAFFNTVKSQIDGKLPMYLSLPATSSGGAGHAVVVDQYSDDILGKFIHVNFGWAGAFDGFINIESGSDIEGLSLTSHQMNLYYNIKPCSEEANDCYDNQTLETLDSFNGSDFLGEIDNGSDEDEFELFLSGETTITPQVYQGSYPAYFVNLYDSQGKLLASFDKTYTQLLQTDKYKIILSKVNHIQNAYYPYNESNPNGYYVTLQTQSISQEQKDTIENDLKKPPLFFENLKPLSIKLGETKIITINAATNNDKTQIVPNTLNDTIISLSSDENLIHITGKATGFVSLDITASSNGKTAVKSIPILVLNSDIVIGKNGIVSGAFSETNLSKIVEFQVLLDGQCSIKGDRGFSNGAGFFIGIDEAPSTDENISKIFNQGIYTIKASLESSLGYYMVAGHPNFTIGINCDKVEETSEYLAKAFGFTEDSQVIVPTCTDSQKLVNNICVAKTCQADNYNCPTSCQTYQTLQYNNDGSGYCATNSYPISYLPSDSSMGQITSNQSGTSLVWGTTFTLTATPLEGFKFVKWSDENTTNPRVVTVNQAIDLNATFAPKTCQADSYQCPSCQSYETLSYNENGSGVCSINSYSLTLSSNDISQGTVSKDLNGTTFGYGSVVQITALPLTGYKFEKWSDNNTTNPREVTIKDNTTLSASFVAKTCQADNYNCPTTQLALKGGWNLVSLPINTTLYQSSNDISNKFGNDVVIWRYNKENAKQWSVYANGITIPSTVDSLLTIKSGEGFWIKIPSDINKTIVFDSNDTYDVTTKVDINSLSSGWYLLGTGITKTVTELQSSNQNISLLWKYLNGAWQTSFNGTLPTGITSMSNVEAGEGVWVLVK